MRTRLFGDDIVSSTELNRHPGEVLRAALERPVTITRSEGDLVVMRRDQAALMTRSAKLVEEFVRLALRLIITFPQAPDTTWVMGLEWEDQLQLADDLLQAMSRATTSVEDLDALVHEWKESALVLSNPDLMHALREAEAAFRQAGGVTSSPLTVPRAARK